jgi:hypothetical protein
MHRAILVGVISVGLAVPAAAQQVKLEIANGRVTLHANGATTRQILDEWARVGGTRIVNGERISGAPLTLTLENVPEKEALEIILRQVAGYMAAPRGVAAAPGASMYDRILVLPTSTAPAATAAAGGRGAPPPRFTPPKPAEDQTEEAVMDEEREIDPGSVFTFPQPGNQVTPFGQPGGFNQPVPPGNVFGQPQAVPFGQPVQPQPQPGNPFAPVQPTQTPFGIPVQPSPFGTPVQPGVNEPFVMPNPVPGQPPVFTFTPTDPTQQQGGFTVIGSPVPGVVQPPPQPNQPPPQPNQQRPPR